MPARAEKTAEMIDLEQQLGGTNYHLNAVLTRINLLRDILPDGTRKQQKRAINLLFDRILVRPVTKIKGVELQDWAQSLFVDLVAPSRDNRCPQGTSNARHVATLAGLKASRTDYTTSSQNHKLLRTTFLQPSPD
jgi:hypothetical protein